MTPQEKKQAVSVEDELMFNISPTINTWLSVRANGSEFIETTDIMPMKKALVALFLRERTTYAEGLIAGIEDLKLDDEVFYERITNSETLSRAQSIIRSTL